MTGMRQVGSLGSNTITGVTTALAPGARTRVSFTAVADKAFTAKATAKATVTAGPSSLVDPIPGNNTFTASFPVVAVGSEGGTTTPPAAQPVVAGKTPAAKAPAKHRSAELKDLASTGASPVLPLVLGSVLLAAGGALLFVLRRRVSRR
jgi:LPXTG-motif cell wall-anchored protein